MDKKKHIEYVHDIGVVNMKKRTIEEISRYSGTVVFDKKMFIETMKEIEKQHNHDKRYSKAFQVLLPDDHVSFYDNHWLQNQLIKILQIAMNDNHKDSWIEYWMWELDWGRKYEENSIKIKGKSIKLQTAEDLWNLLKIEK